MVVVKVMQTGQASFSAARVALMGLHSGRSGPLDAHTPATFSSSHSSSPWDEDSVSGPARPRYPEPLPSPMNTVGDPAPVPDSVHPGCIHSTWIPLPETQEPQILPALRIPTLRPRSTYFLPGRKPAGRPHPSRRKPPSGHRTLPLCGSCGLDGVVKCLGDPTVLPGASPFSVPPQ